MLRVETEVRPSEIAGLGLFAVGYIAAGEIIWQFVEGFDYLLTNEAFAELSPEEQVELVYKHYYSHELGGAAGAYIVMGDNAVYFNHSDTPNTQTVPDQAGQKEGMTVAARNILPGEELTCDYNEFDGTVKQKLHLE